MTAYKAKSIAKFKVFGVGLGKTATHTLSWMLAHLGWRTAHFNVRPVDYDGFDAITDVPTYLYLMTTDIRYPNSKFVLTTRNVEEWLASFKLWLKTHQPNDETLKTRIMSYGGQGYDEERLRKLFERHAAFVRWYFGKYGPEKLLEIDLCDKSTSDFEKWKKLCDFLKVPNPCVSIPVKNAQSYPS